MAPSGDPLPTIDPKILLKARQALNLKGSKNQVALKQIRDLCKENSNIGLLYHCQAKILEDCSDNASEDKNKKKHLEDAISYERKSLELCPKSIKFSFFLAVLLYKSSTEVHGFKGAMQEFSKALKIQLPSDPFHETIRPDRKLTKFPTYEERIENVRGKILNHIGICVIELKALQIGRKTIKDIKAILRNLEATKKEKVCLYWKLLSLEEKRGLLRINVNDLKSHLKSTKSHTEKEVLLQALIFFIDHQKWSFWGCCACNETFPTHKLHYLHVLETHFKELYPIFAREYYLEISQWVSIITKQTWTPIDTILKKPKDQVVEKKQTAPGASSNVDFEVYPSSNSMCKGLLNEIQKGLKELLSKGCLLGLHMDMLLKRAISKLDSRFVGLLTDLCLDKTHYCFGLLNASQLKEILKFLEEMTDVTMKSFKKEGVLEEKLGFTIWDFGIDGVISLTTDYSHLHLDEHTLSNEYTTGDSSDENQCPDKNAPLTSDPSSARSPGVHDLLPWLYSGLSSAEDIIRWKDLKYERKLQGEKELLKYEKRLLEGLKKIQELQKGLSVDGKKIDSGHSNAEGLTESRNLEDQRRFQGKEELLKYEKRLLEDLKRIEEFEKGLSVDGKSIDFSLQEPHKKSENNYSELSKRDQLVLQLALDLRHLEDILTHYAYHGYRPIVLSIVKSYIREKLEGIMDNDTTKKKSDAAAGVVS